jgi:hypothetical protein
MKIAPQGLTLTLIPSLPIFNSEIFGNPELFGSAAFGSFRGDDNAVPLVPRRIGRFSRALVAADVFAKRHGSGNRPASSRPTRPLPSSRELTETMWNISAVSNRGLAAG